MNNNRSDERAILAGCKGVFAPASYITIGTKGCAPTDCSPIHDYPDKPTGIGISHLVVANCAFE